ncbi:hypothetical protein FB45DRAFT_1056494 [Roridomyces roridus]|uniref:Uncharacterized protein n=1 Tax=Roridomyces roridus TaxID=1738132 RepID=A0AAD7FRK1_9AGAR|nr:hypothetical protein FB45DRAFT_1056494 [Roridomyces roridus]
MPSFPAASGVITRFFIETFLFGIYLVLFLTVLYLKLVRSNDRHRTASFWVLIGLIIQWCLIFAHWIDTIHETYHSFVTLSGGLEATLYWSNIARPTSLLQITTFILTHIITDTLVIQRLFVIFSRTYLPIAVPVALLMGQIVAGSGLINVFAHPTRESLTVLALHVLSNGWVTSTLVLSIAISFYSTAAISWKIWSIRRGLIGTKLQTYGPDRMSVMFFFAVFVESAALQAATAIVLLVLFQVGVAGQAVLMPVTPVIYGISTISIHVRVSLGYSNEPRTQPTMSLSQNNAARINFTTTTQTDDMYTGGRRRGDEEHALAVYGEAK